MPRTLRKATIVLPILAVAFFGLCFLCPISKTLFLRPILANFDSHYVSGEIAPMPFERDVWRAGKARDRVGMAHYLAKKKLLDGKTHAELVEMLGEPVIDEPGPEGMRWLLGYYAKGLFDETIWLELTIDEDGKATGAIVGVDWYDPRRQ